MKISFTSKNGYCSEFKAFGRVFYIMNKAFYDYHGENNLYGRYWAYTLMSYPNVPREKKKFDTLEYACKFLDTNPIFYDFIGGKELIFHDDHEYVLHKNGLVEKCFVHEQHLDWFDNYHQCLTESKLFIKSYNPHKQLSFF